MQIVLDTNVVLGWMLFEDLQCVAIGAAIEAGAATWLVNDALRDEFQNVLARGVKNWPCDPAAMVARFDRYAAHRALEPVTHRLRCTDGSDQKFIDLAIAGRATALISRDRAVLRLARRAREVGLAIVTPCRYPPHVGPVTMPPA